MVGKVKIIKPGAAERERALLKDIVAERDAALSNAQFYREALERMRCDLKDRLAMAALTGMLSHGTHHTPEKVMVMVYEFAEAGMKVRGNMPPEVKP